LERGFRDRDYIQTKEDFFFTVVGNIHPSNRITAYLKNIPSPSGKWGNEKKRYERILKQYTMMDVADSIAFLKLNYSEYIYHSKEHNIIFSFVPVNKIRNHYKPEKKLATLLTDEELDQLQLKAILLAKEVSKESNVDLSTIGITGSLLVDIHRPEFSDIDLTVYGVSNCKAVKRGSLRLLQKSVLKRFQGDELDKWCLDRSILYPLTISEARKLYLQKFTILNGNSCDEISEVVSYEGLYADIASEGERIICKGKLEKVRSRDNKKEYYRILVGSFEAAGRDYIKKKAWI